VWSYLGAALVGITTIGTLLMWLVPLVIRARAKNPWTREHATKAANFGLTVLIAMLGGFLVSAVLGHYDSFEDLYYAPFSSSPLTTVALLYVAVGFVGLLVGAVRTGLGKESGFVQSISLKLLK
jgi:hypothetical protein